MIDILKAKTAFKDYISNYDINEPKIHIKIIHMYQVAENARKIAKSLELSQEEQDLAELIGLLHDIGRFEQVRLYHTYSDKISIDHGQKGVEVLFGDKLIRNFIQDDTKDTILYKAIHNHNKFEIEKGLSEEEMLYCQIVRDADNIDIFRAVLEGKKVEEFGHLGCEDISKEILSPKFFEDFKKEKPLVYTEAKTDMDIMVAIIAHIYTLNFQESFKIIKQNNYIPKFVEKLYCQDPYTKEKMNEIARIAMHYINQRVERKEEENE